MSEKLKPCPFCGGQAFRADGNCKPDYVAIHCSSCFASGEERTIYETAKEAWNTRTIENRLIGALDIVRMDIERALENSPDLALENSLESALEVIRRRLGNE